MLHLRKVSLREKLSFHLQGAGVSPSGFATCGCRQRLDPPRAEFTIWARRPLWRRRPKQRRNGAERHESDEGRSPG